MIINLFQLSASLPLFGGGLSLLPLPHLSRWIKRQTRSSWLMMMMVIIMIIMMVMLTRSSWLMMVVTKDRAT